MARTSKKQFGEIKTDRGEIILYRAPDGRASLTVRLEKDMIIQVGKRRFAKII